MPTPSRKNRQTGTLQLIGKLIGLKLVNSRLVTKGYHMVQGLDFSSCSLVKWSKQDKNENCSKTDGKQRSSTAISSQAILANPGPSNVGQRNSNDGNSNINATKGTMTCGSGSKRPKASQEVKSDTRKARGKAKKCQSHRKRGHSRRSRYAQKMSVAKKRKPAKDDETEPSRMTTRSRLRKEMAKDSESLPQTTKTDADKAAAGTAVEATQATTSTDTGQGSRDKSSGQQALHLDSDQPKSHVHRDKFRRRRSPATNEERREAWPSVAIESCQPASIDSSRIVDSEKGTVATPSPNEQEWPPLSKSKASDARKESQAAPKTPKSETARRSATPRRWADIVSRRDRDRKSLACRGGEDTNFRPSGPSFLEFDSREIGAEQNTTEDAGSSKKAADTKSQKHPANSATTECFDSLPSTSTSRLKKNVDKLQIAAAGKGKPQSLKVFRRLFGDDTSKRKKDLLKDKQCLRRIDGASSPAKRNSGRSKRTAPKVSIQEIEDAQSTNCEGGWKIDDMPEIITQPAGDKFTLGEMPSKGKSKSNGKRADRSKSNKFIHAPSTSKRLGSTLEGKLHFDLSEQLSTMSLRSLSRDPNNGESSSHRKSHKKSKRKAISENYQKQSHSGKAKSAYVESTHLKESSKKGREHGENAQLKKVSKKYRALLRGDHGHLDVKKVTEMAKRRAKTPECQGRTSNKKDEPPRRRCLRSRADPAASDLPHSEIVDHASTTEMPRREASKPQSGVQEETSSTELKSSDGGQSSSSSNNSNRPPFPTFWRRPTLAKATNPTIQVQSLPDLAKSTIPICIELNAHDALDLNWYDMDCSMWMNFFNPLPPEAIKCDHSDMLLL